MFPSFIIMFRETLEAALIVGIIFGFVIKTGQRKYITTIITGAAAGIAASIAGAFLFNKVAGGFSGRKEELFEGITMLFGAFLLTTVIIWMMKQKNITQKIERRVESELSTTRRVGLFLLVFIAILREGIESVIFLAAARFVTAENNLAGALSGMGAAVLLGYLIFAGSVRINVKRFFTATGIILIFFAAGLVAHGVHELQEAHVVPQLIEHVWDINPALRPDGSYPLLHENGYAGSIAKGLFGYNGNPSFLEVIAYFAYLLIALVFWGKGGKNLPVEKKKAVEATV
jgi:high-affinity iron transporter